MIWFLLAALVGCSTIVENHGYVPSPDKLAALEIGVSDREAVASSIGVPTVINSTYGESWFYVASQFEKMGIQERTEVMRDVVVVSYDEGGLLSNIEAYQLQDGHAVQISKRVTETNLGRLSIVGQLFQNVGRIDTTGILEQ